MYKHYIFLSVCVRAYEYYSVAHDMIRIRHQGTVFELVQLFLSVATIIIVLLIHQNLRRTHCETRRHRQLYEQNHQPPDQNKNSSIKKNGNRRNIQKKS
jgi:hypothetical protein